MRKNKKAFTLVELLVAMAIIGVLLGLAIFGMATAQRAQRDTERKSALQDINLGIQSYYETYNTFPTVATITNGSNSILTICDTANCASPTKSKTVNLKGAAVSYDASLLHSLSSNAQSNSTYYCLDLTVAGLNGNPGGYVVCSKLENSQILCTGSGAIKGNVIDGCGGITVP